MATKPLSEIAKTIRSKNAGVDKITFDVIFAERADYDLYPRPRSWRWKKREPWRR